jgi:hypothetical protein
MGLPGFRSLVMRPERATWPLFVGLFLVLLSLSPGSTVGMGYSAENRIAASQLLANLGDWASLKHASTPISWPRHGLFESLLQVPFLLLGRLLFGSDAWADRMLSLEPVLATSLLCAVLFAWVRRLTSSLVWSYLLALAAAFGTMLWPYAYIGLETSQSLFLLLAGFLAFCSASRTWTHTIGFAVACGLAVSLKSNGLALIPSAALLVLVYCGRQPEDRTPPQTVGMARTLAVILVVAAMYGSNLYTRSLAPVWATGLFRAPELQVVREPLQVVFNLVCMIGSPNKGLLVYSPVLLVGLLSLGRAYRADRRLALFACLTLVCLMVSGARLYYWSDETWGPRYLHASIAPLLLCLAASRRDTRFRLWGETPFIALTACGVFVSFLGISFYYGKLHVAAQRTSHSSLESLQFDPNWNHIRFNRELLRTWRRGGGEASPWPPPPHWWWERPADIPPERTIDLRTMASPQPRLLGSLRPGKTSPDSAARLELASLATGFLVLLALGRWAAASERAASASRLEPDRP